MGKQENSSRPIGCVLPGVARSYQKVEPTQIALSEHAFTQQLSERNVMDPNSNEAAFSTNHDIGPHLAGRIPMEITLVGKMPQKGRGLPFGKRIYVAENGFKL